MVDDPRLRAARYRLGQPPEGDDEGEAAGAPAPTAEQRAAFVEVSLQQAMRRGDFDHLEGAGKPLRDLGAAHDPDWWIKRKIESERLSGLGPPALTLRVENQRLDEELDALGAESAVRERLADFNTRVIEARRQLLGGPPVVTPTRDVEDEVRRWAARRDARLEAALAAREAERIRLDAMSRRERRRFLRGRR